MNCQKDNKPGYKWGPEGTCYTYNPDSKLSKENAERKAKKQGAAIEISKSKFSCDCGKEHNIKEVVFNEELSDDEKESILIEEIHKDAIIEFLESNEDLGITIEELGINEDHLYDPDYFVVMDGEDMMEEFSKEEFRIIPLYKYVSNIYGPSNVGPNTRPFCRTLVLRTSASLMRFSDITALNGLNPGFGKGGSNTYSIFNYRGGVNCKHKWVKYFYDTDTMNLVKTPRNEQPRQTTVNGRVPYANGTNSPTKK